MSVEENKVKLDLLEKYADEFGIFVETGTATAVTAMGASKLFDKVYTIELDFDYYLSAVQKSCAVDNVVPIYGDSSLVLQELLFSLDEPCVILLDAHFVGDGVIGVAGETPVLEELESIFPSHWNKHFPHTVLIDDYRLFGVDPAYPTVEEIQEIADRINYKFEIVGDVMVISP